MARVTVVMVSVVVMVVEGTLLDPLASSLADSYQLDYSASPSLSQLMDTMEDFPLDTLADLDSYTKHLRDLARLKISKSFSSQIRNYRLEFDLKHVVVSGVRPYRLAFSTLPSTAMTTVHTQGQAFFILTTHRNTVQSVVQVSLPSYQVVNLVQFQLSSPGSGSEPLDRVTATVYHGFLWMVLGSTSSQVVSVACMDPRRMTKVEVLQNIPVESLADLHVFHSGNDLHLVIAEAGQEESTLYRLQGKYFDRIEELRLPTREVRAVTGFPHEGYYYLIFAMAAEAESVVCRFDPLLVTLSLTQRLSDPDLTQALHYIDPLDKKVYLVTLSVGVDPRIYWWTREQLQLWQVLESVPLDHTSSVGSLPLQNLENVLFLAHQSQITFYTEDLSGHYFPTHTVRTNCDRITNLAGIRVETEVEMENVVVYLCHNATSGTVALQAYSVVLEHREKVESKEQDSLLVCMEDLEAALEARNEDIQYLNMTLATDPILTTDAPQLMEGPLTEGVNASVYIRQTWEGPVSFLGGLYVAGHTTFTDTLTIQSTEETMSSQSVANLASLTTQLQSKVERLEGESARILYFSGNQTITAAVTTPNLTVGVAHFTDLAIHNLNGVALGDYRWRYLLSGFDQVINSTVSLDYMNTETLSLHAPINGIQVTDFMRKSVRSQVVTGRHSYASVTSDGISNPTSPDGSLIINGINTTTIVRRGGGSASTVFLGTKAFRNLTVLSTVTAGLVNGIDLKDLASRVVYQDVQQTQTLTGSYTLSSVHVDGNVDVALINGVDLRKLDAVTVKTTGDFTLKGPLRYERSVGVSGDLTVASINDVLWSSLINRSSPTLVTAHFTFLAATVSQALVCDDINGLDVSEDVVLTDTDDVIHGRVTFLSDVVVTGEAGVVVGEGVTVNDIDVSTLATSSLPGFGGALIVEEEATFLQPFLASGNVFTTSLNGLVMEGITERYWRHSVPQVITTPVHFTTAVFMDAVTASSLNGHQMTDFLTFNTSQVITGAYDFQGHVRVEGDLGLGPGSRVDGVDVVALNASVLRLHGDQTIHTVLESSSRVTVGDLDLAGRLNGIDYRTEYWRLDQTLWNNGHVSFLSKTVANRVSISGDLTVTRLNDLDVVAAAGDLVLSGQDATITGHAGLQLTAPLAVTHLNVTGLIDGVDLTDLLSRALLKSAPHQVVSGPVVVSGAVHFSHTLTLDTVNSRPWTSHLSDVVLHNSTGVISGQKTFLAPVTILGNFDPVSVNGVRVRELPNLLLTLSTTQVIRRTHYTFASSISIKNLTSPVIDGVTMDDVLLVDSPGSFSGTTTFTQTLTIHGDITTPTSGPTCDLSQLSNQTLGSDGVLRVNSRMRVERLNLSGRVTSATPLMVGAVRPMQLDRFLNKLVRRSKPQVITGKVEFEQPTNISSLTVDSINDVDIGEMYRLSVLKDEDTIIKCDLEFLQPLKVGNLLVNGSVEGTAGRGVMVNNANLTKLDQNAVRVHGHSYVITGSKTFASMLTVDDMRVNNTLGGVSVGDLVSMSGNEVLPDVTFLAPITIQGNLKVKGLVDGIDLAKVFASRISLSRPQTVHGNCVFESVRVLGDLEVDTINDVKISDLVLRSGAQQVITGQKLLSGGLLVKGSMDTPIINGVDILELNHTVLRRDQSAAINVSVTFEKSVMVTGEVEVGGSAGELNLHNLSRALESFTSITSQQYASILSLHAQVANITARNVIEARTMYVTLDHLERLSHTQLGFHGDLAWASPGDSHTSGYLGITSCRCSCTCHRETRLYKLGGRGHVAQEPTLVTPGSTLYLTAPALNLRFTLTTRCIGSGAVTRVMVEGGSVVGGGQLEVVLGLVADAGVFTVGHLAYIVTAAAFYDGGSSDSTSETTPVTVLSYDLTTGNLTRVWREWSDRGAVDLDLAMIGEAWYLVVASQRGVVSKLFRWDNQAQKFEGVEMFESGVRSGGFLVWRGAWGDEHHLLTLTRHTAARDTTEEDLDDTVQLLVYRYDNETASFHAFESVDAPGVVKQTSLAVGAARYLLLLSHTTNTLTVLEYYPLEGFRLHQTISLLHPSVAMTVTVVSGEVFVYVSTSDPQGVQAFRVKTRGINPTKL